MTGEMRFAGDQGDDELISLATIPVYVPPHVRMTDNGPVHVDGYTRMVDVDVDGSPDLRKLPKVRTKEGHLVEASPTMRAPGKPDDIPRWGGATIDGPIVEYALKGKYEGQVLDRGHVYNLDDRTERRTVTFTGMSKPAPEAPGGELPIFRDVDTREQIIRNTDFVELHEVGDDLQAHPLRTLDAGIDPYLRRPDGSIYGQRTQESLDKDNADVLNAYMLYQKVQNPSGYGLKGSDLVEANSALEEVLKGMSFDARQALKKMIEG